MKWWRDMEFLNYFPDSYAQAQDNFLDAARQAGAAMESHVHPDRGPNGEELVTHVARIGNVEASNLLVFTAGTHGAEGLPGSACLVGWLKEERWRDLPPDTAALLVHFVNPYGVAYRCRQCENNVDLNRNFVDHAHGNYTANPEYAQIHDALLTDDAAGRAILDAFVRDHGQGAFNRAILTGQYDHPDGLFYGGQEPVWSNRTIINILTRHAQAARLIAHIDFHTGLGPYGYGMLINTDDAGSQALRHARNWYGADTMFAMGDQPADKTDDGPAAVGDMCSGIRAALEPRTYVYAALEYGTYDLERLIDVYRADCRLRRDGGTIAEHEKVRTRFEDFFYPRKDDWKELVWSRAVQVMRQATTGLKSS